MRAGELRQRVVIQSKSAVKNEYGEPIYSWSTLATVWAAVEPLTAREFIQGRAELQEVSTRIRMRYRDDVSAENRCTWNGHTYDIESVIHDPLRTELTLLCTEVV